MGKIPERLVTFSSFLVLLLAGCSSGYGRNFHLIDQLPNGFRIYRSGVPSKNDLREFNRLGIQEIAVLSGDADRNELKYRDLATELTVVFDEEQDSHEPLTASFLMWFDQWVQEAREQGKVIAFRCRCGCHRTGRLAAYYQMKYQNLPVKEALEIMNKHGSHMFLHRDLEHQVRALEDYIYNRPCSQKRKYCVKDDSRGVRSSLLPETGILPGQ